MKNGRETCGGGGGGGGLRGLKQPMRKLQRILSIANSSPSILVYYLVSPLDSFVNLFLKRNYFIFLNSNLETSIYKNVFKYIMLNGLQDYFRSDLDSIIGF